MNRGNFTEVTTDKGIENKLEISLHRKYLGMGYVIGKRIETGEK